MKMKYGSVCSGVECAHIAWKPLGWECVFVSEVEPFPCAVLQQRLDATKPIHPLDPNDTDDEKDKKMRESWLRQINKLPNTGTLPNEGDFTKIGSKYEGKYDVLIGGTPCQDLSTAGKRLGFKGKRSVLALDFIKLAYESKCRWIVWENVPGALSANDGRDFSTFLYGLTGSKVDVPEEGFGNAGFVPNGRTDRFGVAWRVLDAQFTRTPNFPHAVPQRRRRVFLIGYFGDWRRAAQVLFEPESMSRNSPPCRKTREEIAGDVRHCIETSGRPCPYGTVELYRRTDGRRAGNGNERGNQGTGNDAGNTVLKTAQETVGALCASDYKFPQQQQIEQQKYVVENDKIVCRATQQAEAPYMNDCCPTLTAMAGMSGNNQPFFCKESEVEKLNQETTYSISTCDANGTRKDRPNGGMYVYETDASKTLSTSGPNSETVVVKSFTQNTRDEVRYINGDGAVAGSLMAESGMNQTNYVVTEHQNKTVVSRPVASTLNCHLGDKLGLDNQHINDGCSLFVMEEEKKDDVICYTKDSHPQNSFEPQGYRETDIAKTLNCFATGEGRAEEIVVQKNSFGADQYNLEITGDVVSTLGVNCGMSHGRQSVIENEVYALDSKSSNSMKSSNPNSGCHKTEVSKTLDTTVPEPSKNQGGIAIVEIEKDEKA